MRVKRHMAKYALLGRGTGYSYVGGSNADEYIGADYYDFSDEIGENITVEAPVGIIYWHDTEQSAIVDAELINAAGGDVKVIECKNGRLSKDDMHEMHMMIHEALKTFVHGNKKTFCN